ncbi:MAG: hypothetical protein R3324_16330, partial [Halobacteriales archaeon]|nr:hypothetical protein [Halobacteriales archaeon]
TYTDSIRLKDVRAVLRGFEDDLVAAARKSIPDSLSPEADVLTLEDVAAEHEVSVDVIEALTFPDHDLVGRTLVRPSVIDSIAADLADGMTLADAESVLSAHGISETSAVLSALGYRVAWDGLTGGRLERTERDPGPDSV